jgi:hypothetical protein
VKRRISLAALAVAGVSLALSIGIASAVGKTGRKHGAPTGSVTLNCSMNPTTMPPQGSTGVVAPASSGYQYGGLKCPQAGFYGGNFSDAFQIPDSGDTVGTYTEYLNTGTIRGSFDITPQEGTFGGGSFQAQTWTGTISVTSGTGAYKGITSPKMGTLDCTSPDSVHLVCTETITVSLPAKTAKG